MTHTSTNSHAVLIAEIASLREAAREAEAALADIADGPEPMNDYLAGVRCGIEDRGLQGHPYGAAETGYEMGLEWCSDIAHRALTRLRESLKGAGDA